MSEALILYRGRGGVDPELLKPTTITSNGNYVAPVTGNYMVYTVGGGGGGGGGCRNSWNSSQVFYGAGGSRGALNTKTVFLNAGDQVSVTLGAGGSGGANNTGVWSNNSRGTNGGSGGTTSFGSYASAAGGSYGAWSWSYHWITSTPSEWKNTIDGYCVPYFADIGELRHVSIRQSYGKDTYYTANGQGLRLSLDRWNTNYSMRDHWSSEMIGLWALPLDANHQFFNGGTKTGTISKDSSLIKSYTSLIYDNYSNALNALKAMNGGVVGDILHYTSWYYVIYFGAYPDWNNTVLSWNNVSHNTTTRCYTSIQQGSWWYQNNNQVSTSGTRTYMGDGGASGQAGNAGFILVIPPQL